jgi:hypothetical protein
LFHVVQEIGSQPIQVSEGIVHFDLAKVLVIALSSFIIVSKDTNPATDQCQPILIRVIAARKGSRKLPDYKFNKALIVKRNPISREKLRLHVG